MSWNISLVENLRYHIGDIDASSYVWSDGQLEKFLAIAAVYVLQDLSEWESSMGGPYSIDTTVPSITPDPTVAGPSILGNLIVLKAGCLIANAELKKNSQTYGWKITDDKSTLDGTQVVANMQSVAKSYCEAYSDAIEQYKLTGRFTGEAIFGPYASSEGPFRGEISLYYNRRV